MSASTSLGQKARLETTTARAASVTPEAATGVATAGRHPIVRPTSCLTPEQELTLSIYARAKLDAAGHVGWRWTNRRHRLQADGIQFMDEVHDLLGYPRTVQVSDLCEAVVRVCQRRQARVRANPRYLSARRGGSE